MQIHTTLIALVATGLIVGCEHTDVSIDNATVVEHSVISEWSIPTDWALISVSSEGDALKYQVEDADLFIYRKPAEPGEMFRTVRAWREAVGIMVTSPLDMDDYIFELELRSGRSGYYGDFRDQSGTRRLYAGCVHGSAEHWYFELSGEVDAVTPHIHALRELMNLKRVVRCQKTEISNENQ